MRVLCPISWFALSVLPALAGCGGARQRAQAPETPLTRPLAVIVEQEVSGRVLGQNLNAPWGLAADRSGRVFVVDAGNNRLVLFDDQMKPVRDMGGYGSAQGLLDRPSYITTDNDLNLWVTDIGNRRVCRFDNRLNFVSDILLQDSDSLLTLNTPSGVAVSRYGEVWLCDRETGRLVVFDNVGGFDRFLGEFGYSGGALRQPGEIAVAPGGDFYICDAGNRRLAIFDEYGTFRREISRDDLHFPRSMAFDSGGAIWVIDGSDSRLLALDTEGNELLVVGPVLPGTSRALDDPGDVVCTSDGRLIISDSGNNRLLVCRVARAAN